MTFLETIRAAQLAALQEFGLIVIADVADADEPIQLSDAYAHLRITGDSSGSHDDTWLTPQIAAAREYCEQYLGIALAARTVELGTNTFPTYFSLPFGPAQSITSVKYLVEQDVEDSNGDPVLDSNGDALTETVELTLGSSIYVLDTYVRPNRLILASGESWPTALDLRNSVKVRYVTGYLPAVDSTGLPAIPKMARSAILLMLAHLYENREAVGGDNIELPLGVHALLDLTPGRERLGMA